MFSDIHDREELVELYHTCFPDIVREEDTVRKILFHPEDRPFGLYEEGRLVAACLVHGRGITLLAVRPGYRRKGYGQAMLTEAEERIQNAGYALLTVGVGTDDMYLMPGVPMNEGADAFFRKRGYTHKWGETGCFDMNENLDEFSYTEYQVGDTIDGIMYRWATKNDLEGIRACVSDAEKGFVPYYMEEEHYEPNAKAPVLIAEKNGQIIGALIVSIEVEGEGRGSVGCTATMHEARGRGIATNMVRLGTRYLKEIGMREAFLGYTYTDIVRMYARAGYTVCQEYFMAMKEF